jgi:putative endonuclease
MKPNICHVPTTPCVYILECADGTLYTGWTNNMPKRLDSHNRGLAAKYTRSRLPVRLVYLEVLPSRSEAMKRECAIKKFSREKKKHLYTSSHFSNLAR